MSLCLLADCTRRRCETMSKVKQCRDGIDTTYRRETDNDLVYKRKWFNFILRLRRFHFIVFYYLIISTFLLSPEQCSVRFIIPSFANGFPYYAVYAVRFCFYVGILRLVVPRNTSVLRSPHIFFADFILCHVELAFLVGCVCVSLVA